MRHVTSISHRPTGRYLNGQAVWLAFVGLAVSGCDGLVNSDKLPADVTDPVITRQALHAWKVALPHPVTRQPLDIEAPLPDDLAPLLQNLTL